MGAPMGNKNAAGSHRGRSKYPKRARGIYGEKVRIFGIKGHSAITDKGHYHTSKLFNKMGKSIWRKKGY